MNSHSERDETVAATARYRAVQSFIESLRNDGLSLSDVAELFQRAVAAKRYEQGREEDHPL